MENEKEIKYFSMFTGVGGFELGLNSITQSKNERSKEGRQRSIDKQQALLHDRQNASFSCVGFSEIDRYSSQLLSNKWPNTKAVTVNVIKAITQKLWKNII